MLSRELGTKLTGRYIQTELFPFSYKEYLEFCKAPANIDTLDHYLAVGGFPQHLRENLPDYLRKIFKDIILRDIVVRRNLRNKSLIMQLAIFALSNIGKPFSFNNLTRILEIKSIRTTIDYCDYLQETYLIEFISKYSFSLKQEIASPKKVYCIDNGLVSSISLSFSDDRGRKLKILYFSTCGGGTKIFIITWTRMNAIFW